MLPRDPADSALARRRRVQALHRHDWVVYAKTPLAGPAAVLDYLSRYTQRTAIGNEWLVGIAGSTPLPTIATIAVAVAVVCPTPMSRIRRYATVHSRAIALM